MAKQQQQQQQQNHESTTLPHTKNTTQIAQLHRWLLTFKKKLQH